MKEEKKSRKKRGTVESRHSEKVKVIQENIKDLNKEI